MRRYIPLTVLGAIVLAALACGGGTSGGGTTTGGGTTGGSGSNALFSDDFSDANSGWDVDSSDTSSVEYESGKYVMAITAESWLAWANPGQKNLKDIHVEVTAKNTGDSSDAGFGIICDYTDSGDFYYLAMSVDGFYVIAKKEGSDTIALSDPDNQWLPSDAIDTSQTSWQLGADCANGTLTLYVDGNQIASLDDNSFTKGDVGLIGATFQDSAAAEITFDNFEVTKFGN